MNREEFFKKIEDMGFHIEYDQHFLYVLDKDNFKLASISTIYKYHFSFHHAGLLVQNDLNISAFINLVTEFVCSGAERREKKRDCLKELCSDRCERMKVFIVMDTTENTGRQSIIGAFESLKKAKAALADYVLNTEADRIEPCYVDIAEFEVEE